MKTKKFIWALFSLALFACDSNDDTILTKTVDLEPISVIKDSGLKSLKERIDLEATSISFSLIRHGSLTGEATITGTVTNTGTVDYESSKNRQALLLYERQLGSVYPGKLVSRVPFINLAVGATTQVSFTKNWDIESTSQGEFPPDYILIISYYRKPFLDGNSSNNSIEESGSAINDLF